jgi:hypothetical protein
MTDSVSSPIDRPAQKTASDRTSTGRSITTTEPRKRRLESRLTISEDFSDERRVQKRRLMALKSSPLGTVHVEVQEETTPSKNHLAALEEREGDGRELQQREQERVEGHEGYRQEVQRQESEETRREFLEIRDRLGRQMEMAERREQLERELQEETERLRDAKRTMNWDSNILDLDLVDVSALFALVQKIPTDG